MPIKPCQAEINSILRWVRKVLESKELHDYSKYYELIKENDLRTVTLQKIRNTLELFSHGTVVDYVMGIHNYIKLKPASFEKLRYLTLMTLAENSDAMELELLAFQLLAPNKDETLDILLHACDVGIITAAIYGDCVRFFSSRKRNSGILNIQRLLNIKDSGIGNQKVLIYMPECHLSLLVEDFLATFDERNENYELAHSKLFEFISNYDGKVIVETFGNVEPIIEETILIEKLKDLNREIPKNKNEEKPNDADDEYEMEPDNAEQNKAVKKKQKRKRSKNI